MWLDSRIVLGGSHSKRFTLNTENCSPSHPAKAVILFSMRDRLVTEQKCLSSDSLRLNKIISVIRFYSGRNSVLRRSTLFFMFVPPLSVKLSTPNYLCGVQSVWVLQSWTSQSENISALLLSKPPERKKLSSGLVSLLAVHSITAEIFHLERIWCGPTVNIASPDLQTFWSSWFLTGQGRGARNITRVLLRFFNLYLSPAKCQIITIAR